MVKIKGNKIILEEFNSYKGKVKKQEIPIGPFLGQKVRLYLDKNLRLVANPKEDAWWQVAELDIPPPDIKTANVEDEIEIKKEKWIERGEEDIDSIKIGKSESIVMVGFEYQNLKKGIDWELTEEGIRWKSPRRPQTGELYRVVISEKKKVTKEEQEPSLDLKKIKLKTFELPQ